MQLDRAGRDAASLRRIDSGWVLEGAAAFDYDARPAAVAYEVETNARWETRRGAVTGFLAGEAIRHEIQRDSAGWRLNGAPIEGLGHLVDLD